MKAHSIGAGLCVVVVILAISFSTQAAVSGFGYYYMVYSGTYPNYQYLLVGAFATEDECNIARQADYGDNDGWIPFDGTGIRCTAIYDDDLPAYEEIVDIWNEPVSGGSGGNPPISAEMVHKVATIMEIYQIDSYKAELRSAVRGQR